MLCRSSLGQNASISPSLLLHGSENKDASTNSRSFRASGILSIHLAVAASLHTPTTHHSLSRLCLHQKILKPYEKTPCRGVGSCGAKAVLGSGFQNEYSQKQDATASSKLLPILTSERIKVAAMVALGMALCNADRVVMSVAILPLSAKYKWTTSFAGIVQSSFLWGYLMSPIAGGTLTDRYGGKSVMAWGVCIWSAATLATPFAANKSWQLLVAVRALMGLAEGVAMPCMNNMISRWFPRSERARAIGVSMAGFHLGSVLGLMLTPILLTSFGISGAFISFGLLGFVWVLVWVSTIYKNPQSHPCIKRNELLYIQQGSEIVKNDMPSKTSGVQLPPFGLLLSKPPTWAIIVAHAMNNWGYFILLSWMPSYFKTVLGVNLKQAAWFSALPWAMMATIGLVAGAASDFLVQTGVSVTAIRKIMQSVAFIGPSVALLGLNVAQSPKLATTWLTAAVGLTAFGQAGFLVNHQDIGPQHAGVLLGMSNTAGTLAAILSTVGTGFFVEWLGSFQAVLMVTSFLYVLSALVWNIYATGERVFEP
ncbi:hypothetical protein O6H91_17G021200 [Diphasiastrum complanatum]|uniref:Uncharacterized protein n=1 Tax=Diphasiastrum complanatum TaxID=34168 RepID=A0ACC2B4S4_DIPCM|nr:hypothetical protein O6H91_17G021200 [Diphasiastrum complanatum]